MSVAYVAYQNLTPQVRTKANALLARNPDYQGWVGSLPAGTSPANRNRMVFMLAAKWADDIKGETGYSEDDPQNQNICSAVQEEGGPGRGTAGKSIERGIEVESSESCWKWPIPMKATVF